jgi:hypothetical protein
LVASLVAEAAAAATARELFFASAMASAMTAL